MQTTVGNTGLLTVLAICAAATMPARSEAQASRNLVALHSWWSSSTGDYRTTSHSGWLGFPGDGRVTGSLPGVRYEFQGAIGWIHAPDQPQPPNTRPLYGWFSESRGDYFTTSDPVWAGAPGEQRSGYRLVRLEGYIDTAPVGAANVALRSWWNPTHADNLATTSADWSGSIGAARDGYTHFRVEGYVISPESRSELKRYNDSLGLPSVSGAPEAFRDQKITMRCQVFAATAALEAAYKRRHSSNYDFSEEFLGYLGKVNWLHPYAIPEDQAENQVGFFAGGGAVSLLHAMEDGLPTTLEHPQMPLRSDMRTLTDASGRTIDFVDDPQDVLNALNWGPVSINGGPPLIGLPQTLLEQSRYFGVQRAVTLCDSGCAGSISAADVERVIREGREVAWDLGPHSMLIIGYDRIDPSNPYFIVKNSYGFEPTDEDGFLKASYEDVLSAAALGYIAETRTPGKRPDLLFLGRWTLAYDRSAGELVVNHLPGTSSRTLEDYFDVTGGEMRLGTYKDARSAMFRVNGEMDGTALTFHIDPAKPRLGFTERTGLRFQYFMAGANHQLMAGFHTDRDGRVHAGYATKGLTIRGVGSSFSGAQRWLGVWDVSFDKRSHVLTIERVTGTTVALIYQRDGIDHRASGTISGVALSFLVDGTQYRLQELTYGPGIAAGHAARSGTTIGVVATRR